MKTLYKILLLCITTSLVFSCTKEEKKVILENGTAPTLAASVSGPIVFDKAKADNNAVVFSWNNPDYTWNTGVGSHNVNYLLEIDTTGSNFSNPLRSQVSISSDLSKTFTVKELNALLNSMNLNFGVAHQVEFRLRASLMNGAAPLYSNVIKMTMTPYLDTKYPVPAKLFIIGEAVGSWDNPVPASNEFSLINAFTYEITIPLVGGKEYLFIPVNGSWSEKYGYEFDDGTSNSNPDGDNFKPGGENNNMRAPSISGTYKITVDFKTGKWTVAKQ